MKSKAEVQFAEPGNRQGNPPPSKPVGRYRFLKQLVGALGIFLLCSGVAPAQDNSRAEGDNPSAIQLRRVIDETVGGIPKFMVPEHAPLPPPPHPDGTVTNEPRFHSTDAKRYLRTLNLFDSLVTAP